MMIVQIGSDVLTVLTYIGGWISDMTKKKMDKHIAAGKKSIPAEVPEDKVNDNVAAEVEDVHKDVKGTDG
jgi:hypothetical protein